MTPRIGALLAPLLLVGCASGDPAPTAQLKITEQALAQARAVGASGEQASLRQAETGLDAARKAFQRQRYRKARLFAERAELDARLAEAQALSGKDRARLAELKADVERLRGELRDLQ